MQPSAEVPVTIYVVVVSGALKAIPLVIPLSHVYNEAPVPLNVNVCWLQIEISFPAPTVGRGFTVILTLSKSLQPLTSDPITV